MNVECPRCHKKNRVADTFRSQSGGAFYCGACGTLLLSPSSTPSTFILASSSTTPLKSVAGWLVLLALIYVPLALGCTQPWAILALELILGSAIATWFLDCVTHRSWPKIPVWCWMCVVCILMQGWVMVLNPHGLYEASTGRVLPLSSGWLSLVPGAVDRTTACESMLRVSVILGAFGLACDLGRESLWRLRFWSAMVMTGVAVVLLGLLQKAGVTDIAVRHMERHQGIAFGTFNYHGNAGAFINIVLPLSAGLALLWTKNSPPRTHQIVAWVLPLICLVGAMVNVSRAAQAIAVIMLVVLVPVAVWLCNSHTTTPFWNKLRTNTGYPLVSVAVLICTFLLGGVLLRSGGAAKRWADLPHMISRRDQNARAILARVTTPMAAEAGLWGSGPGSFKLLLPQSPHMVRELYPKWIVTKHTPGERVSIWSHAHNDYVQTVIEWGWLGSLPWGVLLIGGFIRLWKVAIRQLLTCARKDRMNWLRACEQDTIFQFCAGLALLSLFLHMFVDFPLQIASLQLYVAVLLGLAWSNRES